MIVPKTSLLAILVPLILFFCALNYASSHYYRDPTSKFFDPSRAYQHSYSSIRQQEAAAFVAASAETTFRRSEESRPLICIAILTVARPSNNVYLRSTVGSLLAGLTPQERDAIYVMPFIGHTNASEHPVYAESWLHNVADLVLTYNNSKFVSAEEYEHIQELEKERKRIGLPDREKHMFDYIRALKECEDVKAEYVAIFEDDVLSLDGWLHRTRDALKEVEKQTKMMGETGFFYLRLFYTETQLGWNSEEWLVYLRWILPIVLAVVIVHGIIFRLFRRTSLVKHHGKVLSTASIISTILIIIFFFSAGRVTMLPMQAGVHEMEKYGCCAQAIVYPRDKALILAKWYTDRRIGFVDTLAEQLGDEQPNEVGRRWALTPSVVQHIGSRSSKGDAQWDGEVKYVDGKTTADMLWNFAYELNDPEVLDREHKLDAGHRRN